MKSSTCLKMLAAASAITSTVVGVISGQKPAVITPVQADAPVVQAVAAQTPDHTIVFALDQRSVAQQKRDAAWHPGQYEVPYVKANCETKTISTVTGDVPFAKSPTGKIAKKICKQQHNL
jgi:hypothetical protein